MSDIAPQPDAAAQAGDLRTMAIIVYGLYLAALFTAGTAGIAGVVLAYIKRDEARGTIWESHFENAIHAFWIWLVLMVVGVATSWFIVGIFVAMAAFVYFLYPTVKG